MVDDNDKSLIIYPISHLQASKYTVVAHFFGPNKQIHRISKLEGTSEIIWFKFLISQTGKLIPEKKVHLLNGSTASY